MPGGGSLQLGFLVHYFFINSSLNDYRALEKKTLPYSKNKNRISEVVIYAQ